MLICSLWFSLSSLLKPIVLHRIVHSLMWVRTCKLWKYFLEALATPVQEFEEMTQLFCLLQQLLIRSVCLNIIQLQLSNALFETFFNFALLLILTFKPFYFGFESFFVCLVRSCQGRVVLGRWEVPESFYNIADFFARPETRLWLQKFLLNGTRHCLWAWLTSAWARV